MQYKPLTPSQQEKYDHRFEKLSAETEEMPDLEAFYGSEDEEEERKIRKQRLEMLRQKTQLRQSRQKERRSLR